jgi:hypothetical protein
MTAKVRGVDRHRHEMPLPGPDVAVAARTHIGLRGLIGLHATDLDGQTHRVEFVFGSHGDQPKNAQMTRPTQVMSAAATMT